MQITSRRNPFCVPKSQSVWNETKFATFCLKQSSFDFECSMEDMPKKEASLLNLINYADKGELFELVCEYITELWCGWSKSYIFREEIRKIRTLMKHTRRWKKFITVYGIETRFFCDHKHFETFFDVSKLNIVRTTWASIGTTHALMKNIHILRSLFYLYTYRLDCIKYW